MPYQDFIWIAQLVLSAMMTGIIWQVQVLNYPQLLNVPEREFPEYHRCHTMRMGWIVVPLMVPELGLAAMAAWMSPRAAPITGLVLVVAAWASTGLIQVPLHNRLLRKHDRKLILALGATNWIRTGIWSARTALLLWIVTR